MKYKKVPFPELYRIFRVSVSRKLGPFFEKISETLSKQAFLGNILGAKDGKSRVPFAEI